MNDGIYHPFSDARFAAYKDGITKLIDKVKPTGAKLVLLTPSPFDPLPLRKSGKLRPAGAEKYAWFAPYEKYDDVLARYADWIMQQGDRVDKVIDIRTPMLAFAKEQRADNPEYAIANDGIHFNEDGHRLAAAAILQACGIDADATLGARARKLTAQRQFLLRDAWLSHVGHKRPGVQQGLPLAEAQAKAAELDRQIRSLRE
jgi:hypothetical protein